MAVNLKIQQPISKNDQVVSDENGNKSALFLSNDGISVRGGTALQKLWVSGESPKDANAAQLEIEAFIPTNPLNPQGPMGPRFSYHTLMGSTISYGYLQSKKVDLTPLQTTDGGGSQRISYMPFALNPLGGNIGIGTVTPSEALEVKGNVLVSGDIMATGDVRLLGADCAENFDVDELQNLEPGSVMVIGDELTLYQCAEEYDKRVAGILSGAGIYRPGIVLDQQQSAKKRMPLALTGKVYCKVDAQYGPISIGDLLTTSPTIGHAMKALDPLKAFGAVIGKALCPLTSGQGLIPVLVALQ